jgi:hypothetical protein
VLLGGVMALKTLRRSRAGFSMVELVYASVISVIVLAAVIRVLVDFVFTGTYSKKIDDVAIHARYDLILNEMTELVAAEDFIDNFETFGFLTMRNSDVSIHEILRQGDKKNTVHTLEGVTEIQDGAGKPIVQYIEFGLPKAPRFVEAMSNSGDYGPVSIAICLGKKPPREDGSIIFKKPNQVQTGSDTRLMIKWDYYNVVTDLGGRQGSNNIDTGVDNTNRIFIDDYVANVYLRPAFTGIYGTEVGVGADFFASNLMLPDGSKRGNLKSTSRSWKNAPLFRFTQENFSTFVALGKFGFVSKIYIVFEKK